MSGFNITSNISLLPEFNAFAGFTLAEVRAVLEGTLVEGGYTLSPDVLERDLRRYYNGYLFSGRATERVFNPDMMLYFFKELRPPARYPNDVIDINLRTDYGRIRRLLFSPDGAVRDEVVTAFQAIIAQGFIDAVPASSFPLDRAHEEGYFISLLYYMGLLTHQWEDGWLRLGIPNYAVRLLYWEAIGGELRSLGEAAA